MTARIALAAATLLGFGATAVTTSTHDTLASESTVEANSAAPTDPNEIRITATHNPTIGGTAAQNGLSGVTTYQETSASLAFRGSWSQVLHPGYLGRRALSTTHRGASASLRFTGIGISWTGPIGPTRGKAKIYIDGRYVKTVDTYSPRFAPSRVIYSATYATERPRTLAIEVLGTSGHPTVAVDALVVRSRASLAAPAVGGTGSAPASTPAPTSAPTLGSNPSPTPTPKPTPTPTPKPTPTPTPKPTPTPTATPSSGSSSLKIVQFGPSGSPSQFLTLMKDMTIDVIEMRAGTYVGWHLYFDVNRTRPLLIRPASGAAVIWDGGSGANGDGVFYAGYHGLTSHITFDPSGTGGSFTIANYALGQQGLVCTFWVEDVAFNGFHTRGISGLSGGSLSWTVYISSDGSHRGNNITVNDWDVAASVNRNVGGLQTYHDPQASNITALRWRIDGASSAMTLYGDGTGIDVEDWTISNSEYAVYSDGVAAGVLRNNTSTGSTTPPVIRSPLIDGGGNSWQ